MRININNPDHIEMVSDLCNKLGCSPTQMIINLITELHEQHAQGCKEDAKNTNKEQED
jgi:hypothetical protein